MIFLERFLKRFKFFKKEKLSNGDKNDSIEWKVFEKFKNGAVMDGTEIEADILDRWALTGMATFGFCNKGGTAKITEKGKEIIPILLRKKEGYIKR